MSQSSLITWLIVVIIIWFVFGKSFLKGLKGNTQTPKNPIKQPHQQPAPKQADAVEGDFWQVANPKPSDVTVHLIYQDANRLKTKRTVEVRGFDPDATGAFNGFCLMRNAYRTFLYERVLQAINPNTGEIISNLPNWLQDTYNNTPQGEANILATENIDLFKVLLYIAKADGRMTTKEIEVISNEISLILGRSISFDATKAALNMLANPSVNGYQQAVARLITSFNSDKINNTIHAAQGILKTQKSVHPVEQSAVDYLIRKAKQIQ